MNAEEKIKLAYSPESVQILATLVGQSLSQYYHDCQIKTGRTLPELTPQIYTDLAGSMLDNGACDASDLIDVVLKHGHRLHDPRYMGHQVPPAVPAAAFFDLLGKASNQGAAVFEMAPFGSAAERALIDRLGSMIGWTPGTFAGIGTHGGTLANVTALLAARNIRYKGIWASGILGASHRGKPAIMTSADSHYCMARACGILGLGTDQLIKVPVDALRRMDMAAAQELLTKARSEGLDVFAIVGSACTTPTGSFDDLNAIAKLAQDNNLWFHVDGAHGASFLFSPSHRHLLSGISHADSVAWDAHKMLFVPALCTYLFYKNPQHSWEAFAQDAPYLFDPNDAQGLAEFDGGLRTFECTKSAMSLGLWGIWSLYGRDFFSTLMDQVLATTQEMFRVVEGAGDFEAAHTPQCNIFCFRYRPSKSLSKVELSDLQKEIRSKLLASGHGYITGTKLDGEYWLRVTIINPLSTRKELEELINVVRRFADSCKIMI